MRHLDWYVRHVPASLQASFQRQLRSVQSAQALQPEAAAPSGSPVSTSPKQLSAVIDKQSFKLVELKKKLKASEEHVLSLRREIQAVKASGVVAATKAGQCFQKHDCNILQPPATWQGATQLHRPEEV